MILCFGIFAGILSRCSHGLSRDKFVPRIAWVVDRQNSSLGSGLKSVVDDPDSMEGNTPVVSRLLSCDRPLKLREKVLPSLEVARERFSSKVMPFINENMVAKAVLAVRYIISLDDTIDSIEGNRKETFRKYFGMYRDELLQQISFDVPDFFARVLLYTTCINNKEGQDYVATITDKFIEEATDTVWAELKWDIDTQTLDLLPSEEEQFFEEVNFLSELRLSAMKGQEDFTNMGWLGVDESTLFPSSYRHIEFKDPEDKRMVSDKLMQYIKLVHEFVECLTAEQQSALGQAAKWPIWHGRKFCVGVIRQRSRMALRFQSKSRE